MRIGDVVVGLKRARQALPSWFCIPASEERDAFPKYAERRGRPAVRTFAAYCGAPPGVRCRCGAQLSGHDPGDEDPRSP